MTTGFIPISEVINEWQEDLGIEQEVLNYESLKRKASDCSHWFHTTEQLSQKIKLIPTELGKVDLGPAFKKLQQIAYRIKEPKQTCTTKKQVTQWVQHDYYNDLDVVISIKCDKCRKDECTCVTPAIDIDVDRMWQLTEGWKDSAINKFARAGRFGHNKSVYSDKFILMEHANQDFHAVQYHIPECHNLSIVDGSYKYAFIDPTMIQTDLPKGAEVLVSYLAAPVDKEGDVLIANHPDSIDAIKYHLSHWHFMRKYHQTLEQKYLNAATQFEARRERSISLARTALQMPEFQKLYSMFEDIYDYPELSYGGHKRPYIKNRVGY